MKRSVWTVYSIRFEMQQYLLKAVLLMPAILHQQKTTGVVRATHP